MMPAVRWFGRNDVRLTDVSEPPEPGPGMVNVVVDLCGICGTDVLEYTSGPVMINLRPHPLTGHAPPVTLGHEFVGRVSAVGDDVHDVSRGDRVTADACWKCGVCRHCGDGDYHLCLRGGALGLHSDGALASIVQLPAYMLVRVPDEVSDANAALAEPLAVGLHTIQQAEVHVGSTVVVVGFGPIGAAAAMASQQAGARVLVLERHPGRRSLAQVLGFDEVVDALNGDVHEQIRRRLGGAGADVVIDATGSATAFPRSLELTRRGGTLALAGIASQSAQFDSNRVVFFERRIVGALGYRRDVPRVLELMRRGSWDPAAIVSDEVPLASAIPMGLDALASDPGDHFKILVRC